MHDAQNRCSLAIRGLVAGLALSTLPCSANAETPANQDSHETVSSVQEAQQANLATEWGLNTQEWSRYQTLMKGPRGIYSPGLDPLTALGVEARSTDERRRYAELQVHAERQRVEKELAYQNAYDQAFKRLYPDEKIIQLTQPTSPLTSREPTPKRDDRLTVFVQDNCKSCIARVKELQKQNRAFDLYFVDSQGDDERIRRWAIQAGVEPGNVRSRHITLNHDDGRWVGLGIGGKLPAVVREVNGQWQRQ